MPAVDPPSGSVTPAPLTPRGSEDDDPLARQPLLDVRGRPPRDDEDKLFSEPPLKSALAPGGKRAVGRLAGTPKGAVHGRPIVQFSTAIFFGDKNEGSLKVDVVRFGAASVDCSVTFQTEDGSAMSGLTFRAVKGDIEFRAGERMHSFEVPFIRNDMWSATLEFRITLSNPENCQLGMYLHTCRVKVIDHTTFPTNKYRGMLESGQVDDIYGPLLFIEVMKLFFMAANVKLHTVLTLFLDHLQNVYLLATIFCELYLVNDLCNLKKDAEHNLWMPTRRQTAYVLSAIYIFPFGLMHFWTLAKTKIDLGGRTTQYLRANIFRKFLNFTEESREFIHPELLQFTIMEEAAWLAGGYASMLQLMSTLGSLLVQEYFIIARNPSALWCVVLLPLFIATWGVYRNTCWDPPGIRDESSNLARHCNECCLKYTLISEYFLRPQANAKFVEGSEILRAQMIRRSRHYVNTDFGMGWLTPIFVGAYISLEIPNVFEETLPLGTFLATIHVIRQLGSACVLFYHTYMSIVMTFKAMRSVVWVLNKQTDLLQWKRVNRKRRSRSAALMSAPDADADLLPIRCEAMGYSLQGGTPLLKGISVSIPQGKLVCVEGPHDSGKSTFMQLLAHRIFPTTGELFVPSHLRVLHVSREAMVLDRTLLENLTLGLQMQSGYDLGRIRCIMDKLQISSLSRLLETEVALVGRPQQANGAEWVKRISHTSRNLVGLARAFIMNPEVMILQSPCQHYHKDLAIRVQELLAEHVENRGLGMPEATRSQRRPRTVFYTLYESTDFADISDIRLRMEVSTTGEVSKVHSWTVKETTDG